MAAQIILSSKGKTLLVLKKFLYVQHSKNPKGTRQYWRCNERHMCNARCTTSSVDFTEILRDGTSQHTHPPNQAEIAARAVQRVKRHAEEHPNQPAKQIIMAETRDENDEVLAHLPEAQNFVRLVNRAQNRRRPLNPNDLLDLEVVAPYDVTIRNQNFPQYDSGPHEKFRVIIFTTKRNIARLYASTMIFSNGTFKTASDMFVQLFTVHGLYKNHLFPLAYALTTSKDEVTRDILFRELKNIAETEGFDLKPTTMMSDFELANINQAKVHFPEVRIKNCLFHFSQNIWRNCVERGLKTACTYNKPIRQRIMHLFGLPFVPLDDVEEVFNMLQDDEENARRAIRGIRHDREDLHRWSTGPRPKTSRRSAVPP